MSSDQRQNSGYEISDPSQLSTAPTVSVLVLAYNHEPYVRQAIESILEQVVDFPIEIVVGEDCSTDRTREILLEYQSLRPELFRIITSDANVGMNQNFIRTSNACRGKYIAICEADDYWIDINKLSLQLSVAESNPNISLVVHNAIVDQDGKPRHSMNPIKKDEEFDVIDILEATGQFAATASYFIRSNVIASLPSWLDDAPVIDFFIEAYSQRTGSGYFMSRTMSVYRLGQAGGWTNAVLNNVSRFQVFKSKMIYCYQRMNDDFPEQQIHLTGRIEKAASDIFLAYTALDREHYFGLIDSPEFRHLSKLDSIAASIDPLFFRSWRRTRSFFKRAISRLGISLA